MCVTQLYSSVSSALEWLDLEMYADFPLDLRTETEGGHCKYCECYSQNRTDNVWQLKIIPHLWCILAFISNSGLLKNTSCVLEITAVLVQGLKVSVISWLDLCSNLNIQRLLPDLLQLHGWELKIISNFQIESDQCFPLLCAIKKRSIPK